MAELVPPMSQADLVRASGVSDPTIRDLMRGTPGGRRDETLWKVSIALGWERGRIHRILAGDETPPPSDVSSGSLAELRDRVQAIRTSLEVERAEAVRSAAAIARLADELKRLLHEVPRPGTSEPRPSTANH